ncbi:MAG: trigger factor [Deltaproteobacteria bacterium]|nr:trigger factor [Deltaproteobacteria bacterium]
MKSECQTISPVMRRLDVTLDGEQILKEIDKAYRKVGQRATIQGFRKGKVPRVVLEQHFKAEVESDVLSRMIGDAYKAAIDEHELHPVNQPQIKAGEYIPGQDFRYSAEVEIRPEIEIKRFKGLSATRGELRVASDDEVARELDRLRQRLTQVVPVEDRDLVEKGDLVLCNFNGTVDGETFKGGQSVGYVVDTVEYNYLHDICEALPGKKLHQTFEVEATIPEGFHNQDVAGKSAHFEVTPTQIKRKQLPEIDDEFAKDLGDYDSLQELREKIRGELNQRYSEEHEEGYKKAVVDALIAENPFEVPPSLVERQIDVMLYQSVGRIPPEQLQAMGIDVAKLRGELRPNAEWKVRRGMLLERIADLENVQASKEDVDKRIQELADKLKQPVAKIRSAYHGEHAGELAFSIRLERALQLVIDNLAAVGSAPTAEVSPGGQS